MEEEADSARNCQLLLTKSHPPASAVRSEPASFSLVKGTARLPAITLRRALRGNKGRGENILQCLLRACSIHPRAEKESGLKCQEGTCS